MSHSVGQPPSNPRELWIWWVSMGSGSLSLLCSFIALCLLSEAPAGFVDALYSSAHLLMLHMPHDELNGASKNILALVLFYAARFFAVVAIASTGVAVVVRTLGREIRLALTARSGNHAIICGLGPIGGELASEMIAKKYKVVVVDRGHDEASVNGVLESGASVIVGDPTDPRFLRQAGVASANFLFAASSDDTANISAGLQATGLVQTASAVTVQKDLRIYVHVADPQLRSELHKRRLLADSSPRLHTTTFSVFDNSARLLLHDHPLDHVRIHVDDVRQVQLVLAGFGILGEAILVRAALAGHYANLKRLRAVIIDPEATRAEKIFRSRYPQFDKVAEAKFVNLDLEEPDTLSRIAELCEDPLRNISTVVVPLEQRTRALTVTLSLADRLHGSVPIRFRLDEDGGIGELIQRRQQAGVTSCPVTPFGTIAAACRSENWANNELDIMARALHEDYVSKLGEAERNYPANPSAAPWDSLSEQLRESNRQAADHLPVKLRAVGCHPARVGSGDPGELISKFTDEEIELLAKMEHRRWMAERFLAGWVLGPKNHDKRISPYLVEWEQLPTHPTDIPEYDRNAVRILPGVMSHVAMEIRR
jgi:hypothetical protein